MYIYIYTHTHIYIYMYVHIYVLKCQRITNFTMQTMIKMILEKTYQLLR